MSAQQGRYSLVPLVPSQVIYICIALLELLLLINFNFIEPWLERPPGRKAAKRKRKEANNDSTKGVLLEARRKNDLIEVHNAVRIFEKDLSKIEDEGAREYFSLIREEYLDNLRVRQAKRTKGKKPVPQKLVPVGDDDVVDDVADDDVDYSEEMNLDGPVCGSGNYVLEEADVHANVIQAVVVDVDVSVVNDNDVNM